MEDFHIGEFLSFIKKHIAFFVSIIVVVLVIGMLYFVVIKKPMYSSDVDLTLTGTSGQDKITTNDITLNTKMLPTYQEVITSRKVLDQVINNLKLNKSVSDLTGHIKIQAVADSMVLTITVTDANRVVARDVANEVASIFSEEIKNLYHIDNVTILDKAIINDSPINVNYVKSIIISLAAGIMLSLISLFIVFYLDTTIKGVEYVSSKLGMVVLGGVPFYGGASKGKKKGGK